MSNSIKNEHTQVKEIIKRKKDGIDCTEEESAIIKQWIKNTILSVHDETVDIEADIQEYLPLEYGEAIDERGEVN